MVHTLELPFLKTDTDSPTQVLNQMNHITAFLKENIAQDFIRTDLGGIVKIKAGFSRYSRRRAPCILPSFFDYVVKHW